MTVQLDQGNLLIPLMALLVTLVIFAVFARAAWAKDRVLLEKGDAYTFSDRFLALFPSAFGVLIVGILLTTGAGWMLGNSYSVNEDSLAESAREVYGVEVLRVDGEVLSSDQTVFIQVQSSVIRECTLHLIGSPDRETMTQQATIMCAGYSIDSLTGDHDDDHDHDHEGEGEGE